MSIGKAFLNLITTYPVDFFPIKVIVCEKRGDAVRIDFDRARLKKKDKVVRLGLLHRNVTIEPPEYEYVYTDKKGKDVIMVYSPQEGQYHPLKFNNPNELTIEDMDVRNWFVQEHKKVIETYKKVGIFEKYAPYFILMFTGVILLFTVMMVSKGLEGMTAQVKAAAEAFRHAAETAAAQAGKVTAPLGG